MNLAKLGAFVCGLSVCLGAFGAHAIASILEAKAIEWWQTATEYLWYHGLGFLCLWSINERYNVERIIMRTLLPGVILFSGSLYVYAFTGWRPLGMITPIGGTLLLAGWVWLAFAIRNHSVTGSE